MRAHASEIEVCINSCTNDNVYRRGEKQQLVYGLYCETVMRTRRKLLVPNALKDPDWNQNPDIARGMISYCGLPLVWPNGKVFGTLCILNSKENSYCQKTFELMERFRDNIEFGLENIYEVSLICRRLRAAEEDAKQFIKQLKSSLMSTVEVVTVLSELRDPYTAGHERRVASIATAIGAELGFGADRLEGLQVSGYLHDLGKINIPSEILSKPGKLSPIELQLTKGHSQAGYDVLKNVKFPWPVAEIALQHHERMDGSGYPQGLKGNAILLEARIMGVADVVEAMASHRPYHVALGIEKALEEIERGRDTDYDPMVVDACLKLFRKEGYAIPE